MKLNFYQICVIVFLVGLFGYFIWPTLYAYEDIKVRKYAMPIIQGNEHLLPFSTDEDVRIRIHRINGLIEQDLGIGRWKPYVRPPKCGQVVSGIDPNPTPEPGEKYAMSVYKPDKLLVPCEFVTPR